MHDLEEQLNEIDIKKFRKELIKKISVGICISIIIINLLAILFKIILN